MEYKTLFQVYNWDGGERHNPTDYYFTSKLLGQEYKDAVDKHCTIEKRTLLICDSIEDYKQNTKAEVKRKALAKLTAEERSILGLE